MSLVEEARTVRERIASRLRELEPLVHEYNELKRLAEEMGLPDARGLPDADGQDAPSDPAPVPAPQRRPQRRRQTSRRTSGPRQPSSAGSKQSERGADDVSARVLAAVTADPGKTVGEYAEILDVAPTALYRPARELASGGSLVKRGRQLFPADPERAS